MAISSSDVERKATCPVAQGASDNDFGSDRYVRFVAIQLPPLGPMCNLSSTDGWLTEYLLILTLGEEAGFWEGLKYFISGQWTGPERLNHLADCDPTLRRRLKNLLQKTDEALAYEKIYGRGALANRDHPFWKTAKVATGAPGLQWPEPGVLGFLRRMALSPLSSKPSTK